MLWPVFANANEMNAFGVPEVTDATPPARASLSPCDPAATATSRRVDPQVTKVNCHLFAVPPSIHYHSCPNIHYH